MFSKNEILYVQQFSIFYWRLLRIFVCACHELFPFTLNALLHCLVKLGDEKCYRF